MDYCINFPAVPLQPLPGIMDALFAIGKITPGFLQQQLCFDSRNTKLMQTTT